MANLRNGLAAGRYWHSAAEAQHRHGAPADRDALRATVHAARPGMGARMAELRRNGVTAIESYWPAQRCTDAQAELDQLMRSEPACVRRFSNDSDKRVFGAEMAGPTVQAFHADPFLKSIGELAGGLSLYNFATLGARIDATEANRGSGDGWHRDAYGFQFKAIIYLNDVTDENGPFEYVRGSHTKWRGTIDSALDRFPLPPDTRIDSARMDRLIANGVIRPKRFTAKAGTVILANTAGVHGGAPLKSGHRYALTNYYYFPYQIGHTLVQKFEPLAPGVKERLAPFLESKPERNERGARYVG